MDETKKLKAEIAALIFAAPHGYSVKEAVAKAEAIIEAVGIVSHETNLK